MIFTLPPISHSATIYLDPFIYFSVYSGIILFSCSKPTLVPPLCFPPSHVVLRCPGLAPCLAHVGAFPVCVCVSVCLNVSVFPCASLNDKYLHIFIAKAKVGKAIIIKMKEYKRM